MVGVFLQPNAVELISNLEVSPEIKDHALEVIQRGYTVIPGSISPRTCREMIDRFRALERANEAVFSANRNELGHYPRIVNLHNAVPELTQLLTRNPILIGTLDALFGAPTSLYTSLFYEVGSQQPIHRDTPVFATRPEYLYFGTTVYLEAAGDENGCLEVLERGHLMPELDREAMATRRYGGLENVPSFDGEIWVEYQNTVLANGLAQGLERRKLKVNAGDAVIWHPQLPHGGTPIEDSSRTRFSFVMHVTPDNVPVYYQDAFFAPNKPLPETPSWEYLTVDGRQIASHGSQVSFNENHYSLDQFSLGQELADA